MNIHQAKRIDRCKEITYARRDAEVGKSARTLQKVCVPAFVANTQTLTSLDVRLAIT